MDTQAPFSIGSMVSISLSMLVKRVPQYFLAGFIIVLLPAILIGAFAISGFTEAVAFLNSGLGLGTALKLLGVIVILLMSNTIYTAFIIRHSFAELNNAPVGIMEAIIRGTSSFIPLAAFYFLSYSAFIVSFLILGSLIPFLGILLAFIAVAIMAVFWSVATPAIVNEGLGPIAAMKRSARLTLDHRGEIFGYFVLLVIIMIVITVILGLIQAAIASSLVLAGETSTGLSVISTIFGLPSNYIAVTLTPLASSVLYAELRRVKEGPDSEQILEAFD